MTLAEKLQLYFNIILAIGGVISFLLFIIGWFLRQSHQDMKAMLMRHDEMLNEHNRDIARLKDKNGLALVFIAIGLIGLATGCGVRTAPVSTTTETEARRDSTVTSKETSKDSSSFVSVTTPTVLSGGKVGVTLTKSQLDSLITSLRTMPSGVPKVLYYSDPKMKAQLQVVLDSLGRIHFNCAAADQLCMQTHTTQTKYIEKLKEEKAVLERESKSLRSQVLEAKKPWYQKLDDLLSGFLTKLCLGIIILGLLVMGFNFIKSRFKKLPLP